jgi:hypothetical protein
MKKFVFLLILFVVLIILSVWSALGCDTWVALKDATAARRVLFAKNSDRTVFDCQPLFLHPRRAWPAGATIDLGRISIPQAAETNATLGSSPYWCWGYEEGMNEFGVVIGNEGVFTKPLLDALAAANELRARFDREAGPSPANLDELVGTYIATFGSFNEAEWTITAKDGRLALTIPGRPALELKPPDKDGIWRLAASPQAGVAFLRDEKAGIFALTFRQGTTVFELPKKGVVLPPAIPLEKLQKYVGSYYGEKLNETLEILIRNNALALKTPLKTYELRPPDAEGKWRFRVADVAAIKFEEAPDGAVTGFTYFEGPATLSYVKKTPSTA